MEVECGAKIRAEERAKKEKLPHQNRLLVETKKEKKAPFSLHFHCAAALT